jgi:hypothetical protein
MAAGRQITLRLTIGDPVPGVAYSLQNKKSEPVGMVVAGQRPLSPRCATLSMIGAAWVVASNPPIVNSPPHRSVPRRRGAGGRRDGSSPPPIGSTALYRYPTTGTGRTRDC